MAAKARPKKKGLTILRLDLVSGHMASSVALHWIKGGGNYKQFVENRVHKIQQHPEVQWRQVST